jgi:hypothetical protein
VACGFECGVGLGSRETLVPEVDGEAGRLGPGGLTMGPSGWVGEQCPELLDEAVNALGLRAAISGEVQRVAHHDARATMASRETEDGALIAAGLCAFDGQERLGYTEGVRERDTDAARADIEAKPRLCHARPGQRWTRKWYSRHALMIASRAGDGDYNRSVVAIDPRRD